MIRANVQNCEMKSKVISIDRLIQDYDSIALPKKKQRLLWLKECFPEFLENKKAVTECDYFKYLLDNRKSMSPKNARRSSIQVMKSDLVLMEDIEKNGLKRPLEFFVRRRRLVMIRGYRRLFILKKLGHETVPCKIYKTREAFAKHSSPISVEPDGPVETAAMEQFRTHQHLATDKYWLHDYTRLYDRHLGYLRNEATRILEVGVLRYASLFVWREAFPRSSVFGIDINPQDPIEGYPLDNIQVFVGDQADEDFINNDVLPHGPFDVIVDDASHRPRKTMHTFNRLWDNVAKNGWYIIEDLHWNYQDINRLGATARTLREMINELYNYGEVEEMHFYYNICFIKKRR